MIDRRTIRIDARKAEQIRRAFWERKQREDADTKRRFPEYGQ